VHEEKPDKVKKSRDCEKWGTKFKSKFG
jgi:hypothetical protein